MLVRPPVIQWSWKFCSTVVLSNLLWKTLHIQSEGSVKTISRTTTHNSCPQSCQTESATAPPYISACSTVVDPCILYGTQCILFHNYPFSLRNRHGVFDHSVMILEVHQGLAASSLSPALLQGYSQDVPTKSDGWCLCFFAVISVGVTHTRSKKSDSPVISDAVLFGVHLIETGGRRRGRRKLMTERMKKCHLDFSVNEQRNGHSVDLQWFIRLDPSAALSSAWTVSYSSGTLVCNLVDLLLMNLSISLCLGCFSSDGGVGGLESAKSRLLRFQIQSVWKAYIKKL